MNELASPYDLQGFEDSNDFVSFSEDPSSFESDLVFYSRIGVITDIVLISMLFWFFIFKSLK